MQAKVRVQLRYAQSGCPRIELASHEMILRFCQTGTTLDYDNIFETSNIQYK